MKKDLSIIQRIKVLQEQYYITLMEIYDLINNSDVHN